MSHNFVVSESSSSTSSETTTSSSITGMASTTSTTGTTDTTGTTGTAGFDVPLFMETFLGDQTLPAMMGGGTALVVVWVAGARRRR
ncbi:MAG: hypothetical protein ACP6IT_10255 [Candidatus Thorarchaeota archaeon]